MIPQNGSGQLQGEGTEERGVCGIRETRETREVPGTAQWVDAGCIRAEREDDDGYDPYSDRRAIDPLFERDPWR